MAVALQEGAITRVTYHKAMVQLTGEMAWWLASAAARSRRC